MDRYLKLLKSKTFWSVVVLFLVSGVDAVREFIPDNYETLVSGLLALLAAYFRANPSTNLRFNEDGPPNKLQD